MRDRSKDGYMFLVAFAAGFLMGLIMLLQGCGTAKGVCGDAEYFFHGAGTLAGDMEDAYK